MNPLKALKSFYNRALFRLNRADFYRDFAEMFDRGEPVLSWLEGEIKNAVSTKQGWRAWGLRQIATRYRSGLEAGRIVYTLGGVMPTSDRLMLAAIDRAPDRPACLRALSVAVRQQQAIKQVVIEGAVLPGVMLPLSAILIWIMSDVMIAIDKSAPVYVRDALWVGWNLVAKVIAEFSMAYGIPTLALFGGAIGALLWSLPRWRGRYRLKVESLPVYSMYRDFQTGLLLTSLATFLRTGAPLRSSLEDISKQSNPWMRWHIKRILSALDQDPNATVSAFSRGAMSSALVARMTTLSRSAGRSFADVLVELGTDKAEEVVSRVKQAALVSSFFLVGGLAAVAGYMGLAATFVPGAFTRLAEPATLMQLQTEYQAKQAALPSSSAGKPASLPAQTN